MLYDVIGIIVSFRWGDTIIWCAAAGQHRAAESLFALSEALSHSDNLPLSCDGTYGKLWHKIYAKCSKLKK